MPLDDICVIIRELKREYCPAISLDDWINYNSWIGPDDNQDENGGGCPAPVEGTDVR